MRNPFKKNRGTEKLPDPERIAAQIPLDPNDVTGPMADVMPLIDKVNEFCAEHGLTFVGFLAPSLDMAKTVASGGVERVVHMPMLFGYPPIMPFMVTELEGHAVTSARAYCDEEDRVRR